MVSVPVPDFDLSYTCLQMVYHWDSHTFSYLTVQIFVTFSEHFHYNKVIDRDLLNMWFGSFCGN